MCAAFYGDHHSDTIIFNYAALADRRPAFSKSDLFIFTVASKVFSLLQNSLLNFLH